MSCKTGRTRSQQRRIVGAKLKSTSSQGKCHLDLDDEIITTKNKILDIAKISDLAQLTTLCDSLFDLIDQRASEDNTNIQSLQGKIKDLMLDQNGMQAKMNSDEDRIQQILADNADQVKELKEQILLKEKEIINSCASTNINLKSKDEEINTLKVKIQESQDSTDKILKLDNEIKELKSALQSAENLTKQNMKARNEEIEMLKVALQKANHEISMHKSQNNKLEQHLNFKELDSEILVYKTQNEELQKQLGKLDNAKNELQLENQRLQKIIDNHDSSHLTTSLMSNKSDESTLNQSFTLPNSPSLLEELEGSNIPNSCTRIDIDNTTKIENKENNNIEGKKKLDKGNATSENIPNKAMSCTRLMPLEPEIQILTANVTLSPPIKCKSSGYQNSATNNSDLNYATQIKLTEMEEVIKDNSRRITELENSLKTVSTGNQPQKNVEVTNRKCYIIGDSHSKFLKSSILKTKKKHNITQIYTTTKSGMRFENVYKLIPNDMDIESTLIVSAGTNDLFRTDPEIIGQEINKLGKLRQQVIIISIPPQQCPYTNQHITNLNTKIKYQCKQHQNIKILNTHAFIKPHHLSWDGLHMSQRANDWIANKLIIMLEGNENPQKNLHSGRNNIDKNYRKDTITNKNQQQTSHKITQNQNTPHTPNNRPQRPQNFQHKQAKQNSVYPQQQQATKHYNKFYSAKTYTPQHKQRFASNLNNQHYQSKQTFNENQHSTNHRSHQLQCSAGEMKNNIQNNPSPMTINSPKNRMNTSTEKSDYSPSQWITRSNLPIAPPVHSGQWNPPVNSWNLDSMMNTNLLFPNRYHPMPNFLFPQPFHQNQPILKLF